MIPGSQAARTIPGSRTREVYKRFHRGESPLIESDGYSVRRIAFSSANPEVLLEQDRAISSNRRFEVLLFVPDEGRGERRLVVLLHGLNESLYNKLFPWAAALALARRVPVAIFPMTAHLVRRPHEWIELGRELHPEREALPENGSASPFNAMLSQRLEDRPDRLLRGALQSFADLEAFAKAARAGDVPGVERGTRTHLWGYSAGGYVAIAALSCGDAEVFGTSRAALFASGAAWGDGVQPESLLILDRRAARAVRDHYGTRSVEGLGDPERCLLDLAAGGPRARRWLGALNGRLVAAAGETDRVIPAGAMARALSGVSVVRLALGIHEYPFNIADPLPERYTPSVGRRLLVQVSGAADVAESFQGPFRRLIEVVASICDG